MAFQEYPKALYRQGEYKAVDDKDAEELAREEGYDDWVPDFERMQSPEVIEDKPRRGRPKKVQAEAE